MIIDTHCHLDGEEYNDDREAVMQRAREAGITKIFLPAIDLASSQRILALCQQHPGFLYPMVGLHPEEVRPDWREQLAAIKSLLVPRTSLLSPLSSLLSFSPRTSYLAPRTSHLSPLSSLLSPLILAIGEVGLDFYWSREYEQQQIEAFDHQVRWSVETQLPLMIHCRKAQNELVAILKNYADALPGGVFHCFTGNEQEAAQLLQFPRFVLGIGGVLTFKKSHLPDVLPRVVPLDRIVLETDAPYMAPVPMRGQRNEPAFTPYVLMKLAEAYNVSEDTVAAVTTATAARVFNINC